MERGAASCCAIYQNELVRVNPFGDPVEGNSCLSAVEFARMEEVGSSDAGRFKQGDSKQRREALKFVYSNFCSTANRSPQSY